MSKFATFVNFLVLLWTARNAPSVSATGLLPCMGAIFVLVVGFLVPLVQGWRRTHVASPARAQAVPNPFMASGQPVALSGGPFNGQIFPAPAAGEDLIVSVGNSKVRYRADPLSGSWNYLRG